MSASLRRPLVAVCAAVVTLICAAAASAQQPEAPLQLEVKIPLGAVIGRIDHMGMDPARHRLFVAELGNDTVGVVDLEARKVVHVLSGLKEPQGIGYLTSSDTLYVANGGDGSVRRFQGSDYIADGRLELGDDADNVRVDAASNQVIVGYGDGALGTIDGASGRKVADIRLAAHPESFQLDSESNRVFVNIPDRRAIVVLDRKAGKQIVSWRMGSGGNFPMALDTDSKRVLVMFRSPPKLGIFNMQDGASVASSEACADADDLYLDARRRSIYVSCGAGVIDVFDAQNYQRTARVPTVSGARTSYFDSGMDRLMVAVRATAREPAAIWVYRPAS